MLYPAEAVHVDIGVWKSMRRQLLKGCKPKSEPAINIIL